MDWTLNSPVRNISPCRGRSHSHRAFARIYHSFSARGTFADKAQVSLKLPSEIIFENLTARAPSDVTCLNWWDTCRVRYGQTRISQWWAAWVIEARNDVHVKSNCTVTRACGWVRGRGMETATRDHLSGLSMRDADLGLTHLSCPTKKNSLRTYHFSKRSAIFLSRER